VYGTDKVAHSPLTLEDSDLLKQAALFGPDDERYLRHRSTIWRQASR
jgi:hypothetical protein